MKTSVNDRSVLIDPRRTAHLREVLKRLEALVEDRASKTAADWSAYVLDLIPPVHGDVLDVLSRVENFRDAVTSVVRELRELKVAAERLPSNTGEIQMVRLRAERIRTAWTALGGEGLPEEVLAFLRDAGALGAPLRRLTNTVSAWLNEHDLEAGFVITMRPTVARGGFR